MTRRELIGLASAGAALAAAPPGKLKVGCRTDAWQINPAKFNELQAVVKAIKSFGYDGYETGYRNVEAQFAQAASARHELHRGLRFYGIHIALEQYDPKSALPPWDLIARVADGADALGSERLVLSGSPVGTAAGEKAAALNRAGEYCRKTGLRLAYYNQEQELANAAAELTALIDATDTGRVRFVLDPGQALTPGAKLAEFFDQYRDRLDAVYLRDFQRGRQVTLGDGEIDFSPLAESMAKAKWNGWVIATEANEDAISTARETIRRAFGV